MTCRGNHNTPPETRLTLDRPPCSDARKLRPSTCIISTTLQHRIVRSVTVAEFRNYFLYATILDNSHVDHDLPISKRKSLKTASLLSSAHKCLSMSFWPSIDSLFDMATVHECHFCEEMHIKLKPPLISNPANRSVINTALLTN